MLHMVLLYPSTLSLVWFISNLTLYFQSISSFLNEPSIPKMSAWSFGFPGLSFSSVLYLASTKVLWREITKVEKSQSQKSWKSKHKRLEKGVLEKSYTWQSLTNIVRRNQKSCQTTFKDILWIDYKCLAILFVSNKLKGFTCSEPSASLSGVQPDERQQ